MKKMMISIAAFVTLALAGPNCGSSHEGHSHEVKKEVKATGQQTLCPIMGETINKEFFVKQNGEKLYACSEKCQKEIAKDFEGSKALLADLGETPEKCEGHCKGEKKECHSKKGEEHKEHDDHEGHNHKEGKSCH